MSWMALVFLVLAVLSMAEGSIITWDIVMWGIGILCVLAAMNLQYKDNVEKLGRHPKRKVPRVRVVSVQESREAS